MAERYLMNYADKSTKQTWLMWASLGTIVECDWRFHAPDVKAGLASNGKESRQQQARLDKERNLNRCVG